MLVADSVSARLCVKKNSFRVLIKKNSLLGIKGDNNHDDDGLWWDDERWYDGWYAK
jgi:hypothetical protein